MEYPEALFHIVIPSFNADNIEHLFHDELVDCFYKISIALQQKKAPNNNISADVFDFIQKNVFSTDMCVTFVVDHFGISKAMLQNIVKCKTGNTFSLYVNNQRMERAYQLLREPNASVQQISKICGFSSTNSFYKAFRQKYGVAPSEISIDVK